MSTQQSHAAAEISTKPPLRVAAGKKGGGRSRDWRFIDELILPGRPDDLAPLPPVAAHVDQRRVTRFRGMALPATLEEMIRRDAAALPARLDREGYGGEGHYNYWLCGLEDCLHIRDAAAAAGVAIDTGTRVLDVGCSTGRVLRHFHFQLGLNEVWGAEINARHVRWVHANLPAAFKVFLGTSLPHLPLPDNYFSLVYAISVFTHIDQLELAWLLEIRRVVRPGGVLIVSLHTENTWKTLGPGHQLYNALLERSAKGHIVEGPVTAETFRGPMPERAVFTYVGRGLYHCNVFHSHEYLRRTWGRFFEIVGVRAGGFPPHDMVVLRRPAN